jgi:hypothetical protein
VSSIRSILYEETTEIILRHLETLSQYVSVTEPLMDSAPERILACLERLTEICQYPPRHVSSDLFREACECQDDLQAFLDTMHQSLDSEFRATYIGQVLAQAKAWRNAAQTTQLPIQKVWEYIAPAIPDHLEPLGDGQYKALWWKPVPVMDIEMLKYTEGVVIAGEPFEPNGLSGGLALQFSITPPR